MKNKLYLILFFVSSYLYAEIELYSSKNSYLVGEHIDVHFSGLDSAGSDWVGIYGFN